jgi:hypothetical protein
MSFHDDAPADETSVRLPLTPTSVNGCEHGAFSPLDRPLVTIGRDSALRRRYLRRRWLGHHAIEKLESRYLLSPVSLEFWWKRRLRTPLGRALSRLDKGGAIRRAGEVPHSRPR